MSRELDMEKRREWAERLGQFRASGGPTYRIWVKNNSVVVLDRPTEVQVVVSATRRLSNDDPQAVASIRTLAAGETSCIDLTLPPAANESVQLASGLSGPRNFLRVTIDPGKKIADTDEASAVGVVERNKIPPVDSSPPPVAPKDPLDVTSK